MQVDGHLSNLGKRNLPTCNWVSLELREQHGLDLSKLLEAWKAESSVLEIIPSIMQSANRRKAELERVLLPTMGIPSSLKEVRSVERNR